MEKDSSGRVLLSLSMEEAREHCKDSLRARDTEVRGGLLLYQGPTSVMPQLLLIDAC